MEHLHGGYFETFCKDGVDNLSGYTRLDCVGLDDGARAVTEHGACWSLPREPHVHLSGLLLVVRSSVNGVLN